LGTEQSKNKSQNLETYLSEFEARGRGTMLQRCWRTVLLLLPFIGVMLLSRFLDIGGQDVKNTVAAAGVFFALWHSWDFIYLFVINTLGRASSIWLSLYIQATFGANNNFDVTQALETSKVVSRFAQNMLWLTFIVLTSLSPLYFGKLQRAQFLQLKSISLSRAKVVWLFVRLVLVAIILYGCFMFTAYKDVLFLSEFLKNFDLNIDAGLWLYSLKPPVLVFFGGLVLISFLFGLSAIVFSISQLLVAIFFVEYSVESEMPRSLWSVVLLFSAIGAYPLVYGLLKKVLNLKETQFRRPLMQVAAILVGLALSFPLIEVKYLLIVSSAALFVGIGWVSISTLLATHNRSRYFNYISLSNKQIVLLLALLGVVIGWPISEPNKELKFFIISQLKDVFDTFPGIIVATSLLLILWNAAKNEPKALVSKHAITVGVFFYAIFLIGANTTWLLVPVPFLVAISIGFYWMFKDPKDLKYLFPGRLTRVVIITLRNAISALQQKKELSFIEKALKNKLRNIELTPKEYHQKLSEYKEQIITGPTLHENPRAFIFKTGVADFPGNIAASLKVGTLLAFIPVVITMYQQLPLLRVDYPNPLGDYIAFLILTTAKWLFYAAIFGIFMPFIKGETGLSKGINYFLVIVTPFALFNLLGTKSFEDMKPFFFWMGQVFAYCTLLGVLSLDYRLLKQSGFGFRELKAFHNLPTISAYASMFTAAVVPAIIALFANKFSEITKFFIDAILPNMPSSP